MPWVSFGGLYHLGACGCGSDVPRDGAAIRVDGQFVVVHFCHKIMVPHCSFFAPCYVYLGCFPPWRDDVWLNDFDGSVAVSLPVCLGSLSEGGLIDLWCGGSAFVRLSEGVLCHGEVSAV